MRWIGPTLALAAFGIALWALHRELRAFRYEDIVRSVRAVPAARLAAALALTALAYALMVGYDALALAYVGRRVALRRLAFGSFIAYALSQTLGTPLLTGGAVRYRFWSAWGLSTVEIAAAVSFAATTFTVGLVMVSGAALLLEPADMAASLRLSPAFLRPLGALGLAAVAAYLAWSVARPTPLRIRGWEFPAPPPRLAVAQLLLAAADWAAAAAVLFVLLPDGHGLSFLPFAGAFVIAQLAGVVSHVPGGLGVFDTLLVLLLGTRVPVAEMLGALVAYRAVYYLLPFAAGIAALATYEGMRRFRPPPAAAAAAGRGARTRTGRVLRGAQAAVRLAGRRMPGVLPWTLGIMVFAAGVVLLVSGATPSVPGRVEWLTDVLPVGVVELSHFAGSLIGSVLVLLGWALSRRLDAAYGVTVALLGVGAVTAILKGLDWEEATVLTVTAGALLPSRRAFYRRAALTGERFTPGWVVTLVIVAGVTAWLGLFSYKHLDYSHDLWWQFAGRSDAPRVLRATVGALAVLLVFGVARLLRHAPVAPALPTPAELSRVTDILRQCSGTIGNLALLGDKALLFGAAGDGLLMYAVEGRSWVALGDPVGSPAAQAELAWRFREEADRHGGWPVFYEVGTASLPLCVDLGLTLLKLGEEAVVPLATFSLDGANRRGLRRTFREAQAHGLTFEVVPAAAVPVLLPRLREISDAWLDEKRTREKGFSLGRFDDAYLHHFPVALVRDGTGDGRIVAFANLWQSGDRGELSLDLMRYLPDAPRSVMEYLFIELMLWGRREGFAALNLGMAPLSGFEQRPHAPLWSRAGSLLYRHGEHFYHFRGLRQYKEKFDPEWRPRYLASPGGLVLPRILASVASLIAGGLRGLVMR